MPLISRLISPTMYSGSERRSNPTLQLSPAPFPSICSTFWIEGGFISKRTAREPFFSCMNRIAPPARTYPIIVLLIDDIQVCFSNSDNRRRIWLLLHFSEPCQISKKQGATISGEGTNHLKEQMFAQTTLQFNVSYYILN